MDHGPRRPARRAIPVFVDVDLDTYNLDPDRIETHITPASKAILGRSWMNWTLPELPIFAEPDAFEQRHAWRRTWDAERTYSIEACPNARRMVEETAVFMDVPVAAGPDVLDRIAAGFRKVFSQLDEVMQLPLTPALRGGDLASCQAIREELG